MRIMFSLFPATFLPLSCNRHRSVTIATAVEHHGQDEVWRQMNPGRKPSHQITAGGQCDCGRAAGFLLSR